MRLLHIVIVCLAAATALSGCGRRGGLESPPQAKAQKPAQTTSDPTAAPEEPKPFQKKNVPERPFILDGLI